MVDFVITRAFDNELFKTKSNLVLIPSNNHCLLFSNSVDPMAANSIQQTHRLESIQGEFRKNNELEDIAENLKSIKGIGLLEVAVLSLTSVFNK